MLDFRTHDGYITSAKPFEIFGLKLIEEENCFTIADQIDAYSHYVELKNVEEISLFPDSTTEPWMMEVPITILIPSYKLETSLSESFIKDIPDENPIKISFHADSFSADFADELKVFHSKNVIEIDSQIILDEKLNKNKDLKVYIKWIESLPTLNKYTLKAQVSQFVIKTYSFKNVSKNFRHKLHYMIHKRKDLEEAHITKDFISIK